MLPHGIVVVTLRLGDQPVEVEFPFLKAADANAVGAPENSTSGLAMGVTMGTQLLVATMGAQHSPAVNDTVVLNDQSLHAHLHVREGVHQAASNLGDGMTAMHPSAVVDTQGPDGREKAGHTGGIVAAPGFGIARCQIPDLWRHTCHRSLREPGGRQAGFHVGIVADVSFCGLPKLDTIPLRIRTRSVRIWRFQPRMLVLFRALPGCRPLWSITTQAKSPANNCSVCRTTPAGIP